MITKTKTITFRAGDVDRIVIETEGYAESIFSNQYFSAIRLTESIYNNNAKLLAQSSDVTTNDPNLIVFCGDRGEGKTSCMMTVRHILHKYPIDDNSISFLKDCGAKFTPNDIYFLDLIDPVHFDSKHNILELVLGQLYNEFKKYRLDRMNSHEFDRYSLDNTAKQFSIVKRCLSQLTKEEKHLYDELEELDCLSAGISLSKSLCDLFKAFLRLNNKKQLLICLDDIDYNIVDAYKMVKQISTYLSNPYCIIYITVKLSQLSTLIQSNLGGLLATPNSLDTYNLTAKFVQKLFPVSHRIDIPKVKDIYDSHLKILDQSSTCISDGVVKEIVPKLIFRKTRYLFYNHKEYCSPIIPQDLRGLRQLIDMLVNMPDYSKNSNSNYQNRENKRKFKNYFYNVWIKSLSKKDEEFAHRLINENNLSNINYLVSNHLIDKYSDYSPNEVNQSELTNYRTFYSYNVSLGDALYIISYIEKHIIDESFHKLLFFIKSFYSIQLYENYDAITENEPNPRYSSFNAAIDNEYIESAWYKNTNPLQRLVNGEYFNFKNEKLIPLRHLSQKHDWSEICLGECFIQLLKDVSKNIEQYDMLSPKHQAKFKKDFSLLEYFIFNIKGETTSETTINNGLKTVSHPFFLSSFSSKTRLYVFDVLGIFSNMINIKYAYDRFREFGDFYSFADKNSWTLLNKMRNNASKTSRGMGRIETNHALASDAILRNTEIILTLTEKAIRVSKTIGQSEDSKLLIQEFYRGIINSNIKTYEQHNDSNPKEIKFDFLSTISAFLEKVDSCQFNEIFNDMLKHSGTESGEKSMTAK